MIGGIQCTPNTPNGTLGLPLESTPLKVTQGVERREEARGLEILVKSHRFVAISIANCPQCEELAGALAARGVPPSVFVKWDKGTPEYPALKAELVVHAGDVFSFPQVFADGVYQGGNEEVRSKLDVGAYDEIIDDQFSVVPATVQRWVDSRPMVVFSLSSCPQCDDLRGQLENLGLPVKDIFIKLDKAWPQYQSLKVQIIQLIGKEQFSFPQTFVHSGYEGSFDEIDAKLAAGHFDQFFKDTFGIAPAPKVATGPVAVEAAVFDEDF